MIEELLRVLQMRHKQMHSGKTNIEACRCHTHVASLLQNRYTNTHLFTQIQLRQICYNVQDFQSRLLGLVWCLEQLYQLLNPLVAIKQGSGICIVTQQGCKSV